MSRSFTNQRFSSETRQHVKTAGWFEGRKYNYATCLDEDLDSSRIFPEAHQVWEEFGGLLILPSRTKNLKTTAVEFDLLGGALFSSEDLLACSRLTGSKAQWPLIPGDFMQVGGLPEFNTSILVGENGVAYIDGDMPLDCACYKYAGGIDSVIESVLLGDYGAAERIW